MLIFSADTTFALARDSAGSFFSILASEFNGIPKDFETSVSDIPLFARHSLSGSVPIKLSNFLRTVERAATPKTRAFTKLASRSSVIGKAASFSAIAFRDGSGRSLPLFGAADLSRASGVLIARVLLIDILRLTSSDLF